MPHFEPVPKAFSNLKDNVVVLTGGAHGVGESTIRYLYEAGAHVFFGDIDEKGCQSLVENLKSSKSSSTNLEYIKVDVRKYEDNLALFKLAYEKHGRVDHAFSIAGVTEGENWFDSSLDLQSIEQPPSTAILDINLLGALYFTRIATVYLRQGNDDHSKDKSICLLGSIAAFKAQAGLFVYQPSKHGVMGLFRSSQKLLHQVYGIRINIINPSLINTGMASRIYHLWQKHDMPVNEPEEVAQYVMTLAAVSHDPFAGPLTGLAIYVEGGKGWETEKDLGRCEISWLGEVMTASTAKIDEALGIGLGWTTDAS